MLKLRSLKINKFKLLKEPVEMSFGENRNILIGKNGTGKTTLLELIAGCFTYDFSYFKERDYELDVVYTLEGEGIEAEVEYKSLKQQRDKSVSLLPEYESKEFFVDTLQFNISYMGKNYTIKLTKDGGIISGDHSSSELQPFKSSINSDNLFIVLIEYLSSKNKDDKIVLKTIPDELSKMLALLARFFLNNFPLERFAEGLSNVELWEENAYINIIYDERLIGESINPDIPIQIEDNFFEFLNSDKLSQDLEIDRQAFPILAEIASELGFKAIRLLYSFKSKTKKDDGIHYDWSTFAIHADIDPDNTITESLLSYGQRRFIAIMLYLNRHKNVLVIDEPVNGLHHRMIEKVIEMMESKQSFIANQNPILFDYMEFN
ncbi:MAG: AAA family ATPase, partial [bacterium]|nr:AAA family ATPase [bacterium]